MQAMQVEQRLAECRYGKWDINKTPVSRDAVALADLLSSAHCSVVSAERGAEPELRAKRGKEGKAW